MTQTRSYSLDQLHTLADKLSDAYGHAYAEQAGHRVYLHVGTVKHPKQFSVEFYEALLPGAYWRGGISYGGALDALRQTIEEAL